MKKILTVTLFLSAGLCFGQLNKKILGKWISCAKIETLIKLDSITLVKEDAGLVSACVEKHCVFSRWTFENKDSEGLVTFYREAGCKGAASVSDKSFSGKWSCEKDKKLIIFDDQFLKHVYKVVSFTDKELKLKKES